MNGPSSIYSSIGMAVAAILAFLVAIVAWRRRAVPGRVSFILMMLAVAVYALFAGFEIGATTLQAKIVWSKFSYLGIVNLAPCWLMFAVTYTHPKTWLNRRWAAALWLVPLVTLGLAATNEWHGLIWSSFRFLSQEPGARLIYGHGIGFWIHGGYAYILMLAGTYWLVRSAWHSPRLFRWQIVMVVTASLIPWVGNMLYIFNLEPWPGLDLTPLAFLLTGILLTGSLYRFHAFDLVPVARDIVFNSMGVGVLVLDNLNRLVDINPMARRWMNLGDEAIGSNLFEILQLDEVRRQYEHTPEAQALVEIGEGKDRRVFELTISPIYNPGGDLQGRVALLYNTSGEHSLLEIEHRRARQMELLNAITQAALSVPDFPHMIQTLADRLGELFDADSAYLTRWDEIQQRAIPIAAYGDMRDQFPAILPEPNEKTITESVLNAGHVLEVEDTFNTPYLSRRIAALFPSRSLLALPLIVNEQKLGAVIISFNQIHHFTPDEIALGEQAAGQIALAVARAQLYEAEHHRNAQLTALQSVSQAVASSLDLNQVFETVVHVLNQTFGYPYVSIYRLHGETLHLGAQVGYPEEMVYREIPINRGVLGRAVCTRQPQFVRDVSADPDYLRAAYEVESEICVPLLKDQTVLGTLNIESPPQLPLTEADLRLLITFASQVVVAIDNANLFQAEREQRELAEALREMGMALSESLDLEAVLGRLLDEIRRVVPYDRACVMLVDEESKRARITHMRGFEQVEKEFGRQTITLEFEVANTPKLRQMVETGRPLIVADTTTYPGRTKDPVSIHFRSWAGAPITLRGKVIGFLSLDKIEAHYYLLGHKKIMAAFAAQAAIAIENARIFTEMQRRVEKEGLLFAATHDFTAGLDTEAVLQAIVHHMVKALKVDGCTVSRWDPAHDCVRTLLDYDTDQEVSPDLPGSTYPLEEYPVTRAVIENREPLFINLNDATIDPAEEALMKKYGNQALLMLPLIVGREKQVFGIVELFRKEGAFPFSKSDLEMAQSFSAQAAIAIENARLYGETQQQAIVDDLTGLYNRRGLFELGKREVERSIRFNHPLVALFLDIDHFKLFNDTYSYAVGDQVLRLFAGCLRSNLREFDLVGRYGGEEFVVLLPEADLPAAREVAERVRSSVEALRVQTDLGETNITVSVGVCLKTQHLANLEALIDRAGQAVHVAKQRGRNRVIIA